MPRCWRWTIEAAAAQQCEAERPAQPECWVVHADATISEQYLENTRDEMADELLAAFEKSVEKKLPPVVELRAHRWRYAVPMGQSGFRACMTIAWA